MKTETYLPSNLCDSIHSSDSSDSNDSSDSSDSIDSIDSSDRSNSSDRSDKKELFHLKIWGVRVLLYIIWNNIYKARRFVSVY